MKIINIKRVIIGFFISIISFVSVYGQQDYLFPSQNPPGGLDPVNINQFICIGWDGNSYTGKKGTSYETAEYLNSGKYQDMGKVGGVMFTEDSYNSPTPTWKTTDWANNPIPNPGNYTEGDMGMSWAMQTLVTGDMKMTFNVISGLMQPTYGGWKENPDSLSRLGYNGESYQAYDYQTSSTTWIPICWGREYELVVAVYQSNNTAQELYVNPALGVRDQPNWIKEAYQEAIDAGHEIGNHTIDAMGVTSGLPKSKWPDNLNGFDPYPTNDTDQYGNTIFESDTENEIGWAACAGNNLSEAGWSGVITLADSMIIDHLQNSSVSGFRAPFFQTGTYLSSYRPVNSNLFFALKNNSYKYDCSVASDHHSDFNGKNAFWPFTVDNGFESTWSQKKSGEPIFIDSLPEGLWELPTSRVVVPVSIRDRVMSRAKQIDQTLPTEYQKSDSFWNEWINSGVIDGVDVIMFIQWGMIKEDWVSTMKNTLDLRMQNNKAPFIYSANTDIYSIIYDNGFLKRSDIKTTYGLALSEGWNSFEDRIQAMEEFRDYALGSGSKFVTHKSLIDSLNKMVALKSIGDSSDYVTTWNFIKNDNLNSSTNILKRTNLENVSITIDSIKGAEIPQAAFKTTEAIGTFTNLDHISMTYNTNSPLAIKLHVDGDKPWQVLLNNIGPNVNSGRIPVNAFHYDPDNAGSNSVLDVSKINGVEIQPLTTGAKKEVANFSVSNMKIYGPDVYVVDTLPPLNVSTLNSTAQTTSTISIAWTPSISTNVDSVLVAWSSDSIVDITSAKAASFIVVPKDTVSYKIQGLADNTKYFIRVFANNLNGYWNSGIVIAARTDMIITNDSISPTDITNLNVSSKTTNSITVAWDKSVSTDADFQLLAWSTGNIGDFENAMSKDHIELSSSMVQHTIDSLDHSTPYNIKIFVVDTAENKSSGVSIKDTTLVLDETSPENVTNLSVDSSSQNELIVSWDYADANDVNTVIISWSTDVIGDVEDAKTKSYLNVDPSSNNFKIENLLHNTGYNIKVFVADSLGNWNSGTSTIGTTDENISEDKTPPEPVTALTTTVESHSKINVSWTPSVSEDVVNVLVAWSEDSITDVAKAQEGTSVSLSDSGATSTYLISALKSNTGYFIKVFVEDTANNWSAGVEAFATTEVLVTVDTINPEPVTNLAASAISDTAISLTWTSSTSQDVKSILVAWSEENITDESDAITKDNVTLEQSAVSYVLTGLTAKTFYNIKVFTQDSAELWSPGAAATAKTDSVPPKEILAGDFNGDEKIDVLDFAYVSEYWTKSVTGNSDSIQELFPYYGNFPMIIVDPDDKFNYRDLSVFTSGCHWYYESRANWEQRNTRGWIDDNSVKINLKHSDDKIVLNLTSDDLGEAVAASFKIYHNANAFTYNSILHEDILGEKQSNVFTFEMEYSDGVEVIATLLNGPNLVSQNLITMMFDRIDFDSCNIEIEYEFVNSDKEVFKRGSSTVNVAKLKSDESSRKIKIVPNPSFVTPVTGSNNFYVIDRSSASENEGGFYIDLSEFLDTEISTVMIYDMLGNLINEINLNQDADTFNDKMIYWNGRNLQNKAVSSGAYKVVLKYSDGNLESKISVKSIGVKE